MNEPTPVIQTDNLTRRFGSVIAVDGLTLTVEHGEIFGLVGPDGAGKTTIFRMLAAIMDPSDGRATVAGFDTIKQPEAIKRRIGYMAQQFNLYGDLTVQENLDFYADIFGVRGRERRTHRAAAALRPPDRLHRASCGQPIGRHEKKAGAGVRADPPTGDSVPRRADDRVDPISRREFWDILSELHIDGVSILVSTPYMDEAERCSRVAMIYQGRLVVCDTPERIKRLVQGELVELRPLAADPVMPWGIGLLRRAEAIIAGLAGVLEVQTYGDMLHIFVDDAAERMPQIETALAAHLIQTTGLRRAPAAWRRRLCR